MRAEGFLNARVGIRAILYFINFGLARTLAFCGPILLARVLDLDLYGTIEFSLSVATFVATLMSVGIPSAYPQMTLLRQTTPMLDLLAASVAAPGLICLLATIAIYAFDSRPAVHSLIVFCTVQALAQGALSIFCRTAAMPSLSAWSDSASILGIVTVALCAFLLGSANVEAIAFGSGCISVGLLVQALWIFSKTKQPEFFARLAIALKFGFPVLVQSLTITWCLVSGRVFAGSFLDALHVASYGIAFRIASGLLLVHAVFATALFSELYTLRTRPYDRTLGAYLIGLTLLSLSVPFVVLPFLSYISSQQLASLPSTRQLLPVILLQVFAWGCIALLEMRVARARLAGRVSRQIAATIVCFGLLTSYLGWQGYLNLELIAWLASAQMIGCAMVQFSVLWRRGLKMPWALSGFLLGVGSIAILAAVARMT